MKNVNNERTENETREQFIQRVYKDWIEINKPGDFRYGTNAGKLTAKEILNQIETKTKFGLEFVSLVGMRALFYRNSSYNTIYSFINESMNRIKLFSSA